MNLIKTMLATIWSNLKCIHTGVAGMWMRRISKFTLARVHTHNIIYLKATISIINNGYGNGNGYRYSYGFGYDTTVKYTFTCITRTQMTKTECLSVFLNLIENNTPTTTCWSYHQAINEYIPVRCTIINTFFIRNLNALRLHFNWMFYSKGIWIEVGLYSSTIG